MISTNVMRFRHFNLKKSVLLMKRQTSVASQSVTSINTLSDGPEGSANANCPLKKVGQYYVVDEERRHLLAPYKKMGYISSDIMFMNYHENGFGVCMSRDRELCDNKNNDPNNRILHYYLPFFSDDTFDQTAVEQILEFFDNDYPMRKPLEELYDKDTVLFFRNIARTAANLTYLNIERKKAYFLQFSLLFAFDDLAEHLATLDDKLPLIACGKNVMRVLTNRQDTEAKIDLSSISNFPKECLERAELQEHLQADIVQRLLKHAGPWVQTRYADGYEYYLNAIDSGADIMKNIGAGRGNMYTYKQVLQCRSASVGGSVPAPVLMDDCDAEHFYPSDALVTIMDIAITTETDMNSYYKEKAFDKLSGKLVTINSLDWNVKMGNKSVLAAARNSIMLHNQLVKYSEDSLPLVQEAHRQRYKCCLDNILVCNDYTFNLGVNELNHRYGWYPIKKQDAVFNLSKYDDKDMTSDDWKLT